MKTESRSVCIRCGKERIVVKTWHEKVGFSMVTYTKTACPDKECQKILDARFALEKEKRDALLAQKAERLAASKKAVKTT